MVQLCRIHTQCPETFSVVEHFYRLFPPIAKGKTNLSQTVFIDSLQGSGLQHLLSTWRWINGTYRIFLALALNGAHNGDIQVVAGRRQQVGQDLIGVLDLAKSRLQRPVLSDAKAIRTHVQPRRCRI